MFDEQRTPQPTAEAADSVVQPHAGIGDPSHFADVDWCDENCKVCIVAINGEQLADVCCTPNMTVRDLKAVVCLSWNMSRYQDTSLVCENGTEMKPLCAYVRNVLFKSNLEVHEKNCTVTSVILYDRYLCDVCNQPCNGLAQLEDHLAGKKHHQMICRRENALRSRKR